MVDAVISCGLLIALYAAEIALYAAEIALYAAEIALKMENGHDWPGRIAFSSGLEPGTREG